jgi:hypothetical protein
LSDFHSAAASSRCAEGWSDGEANSSREARKATGLSSQVSSGSTTRRLRAAGWGAAAAGFGAARGRAGGRTGARACALAGVGVEVADAVRGGVGATAWSGCGTRGAGAEPTAVLAACGRRVTSTGDADRASAAGNSERKVYVRVVLPVQPAVSVTVSTGSSTATAACTRTADARPRISGTGVTRTLLSLIGVSPATREAATHEEATSDPASGCTSKVRSTGAPSTTAPLLPPSDSAEAPVATTHKPAPKMV